MIKARFSGSSGGASGDRARRAGLFTERAPVREAMHRPSLRRV
jgi:hypothetical protein